MSDLLFSNTDFDLDDDFDESLENFARQYELEMGDDERSTVVSYFMGDIFDNTHAITGHIESSHSGVEDNNLECAQYCGQKTAAAATIITHVDNDETSDADETRSLNPSVFCPTTTATASASISSYIQDSQASHSTSNHTKKRTRLKSAVREHSRLQREKRKHILSDLKTSAETMVKEISDRRLRDEEICDDLSIKHETYKLQMFLFLNLIFQTHQVSRSLIDNNKPLTLEPRKKNINNNLSSPWLELFDSEFLVRLPALSFVYQSPCVLDNERVLYYSCNHLMACAAGFQMLYDSIARLGSNIGDALLCKISFENTSPFIVAKNVAIVEFQWQSTNARFLGASDEIIFKGCLFCEFSTNGSDKLSVVDLVFDTMSLHNQLLQLFGAEVFRGLGSRDGKLVGDPQLLNDAAQLITTLNTSPPMTGSLPSLPVPMITPTVLSINGKAFLEFGNVTRCNIPITSEAKTVLLHSNNTKTSLLDWSPCSAYYGSMQDLFDLRPTYHIQDSSDTLSHTTGNISASTSTGMHTHVPKYDIYLQLLPYSSEALPLSAQSSHFESHTGLHSSNTPRPKHTHVPSPDRMLWLVNFCKPVSRDYAGHLMYAILKSINQLFQADNGLFTSMNNMGPMNMYSFEEREKCLQVMHVITELQMEISTVLKAASAAARVRSTHHTVHAYSDTVLVHSKAVYAYVYKFLKAVVMLDSFAHATLVPPVSIMPTVQQYSTAAPAYYGTYTSASSSRPMTIAVTPTIQPSSIQPSSIQPPSSVQPPSVSASLVISSIAEEMTRLLVCARESGCTARLFYLLQCAENEEEIAIAEQLLFLIWSKHCNGTVRSLMTTSKTLITMKDYNGALNALNQVLSIDHTFAEAYNKRATVYFALGKTENCYDDVEMTMSLEPLHYGALCGKALMQIKVGDFASALVNFQLAARVNPSLMKGSLRRNIRFCEDQLKKRSSSGSGGGGLR